MQAGASIRAGDRGGLAGVRRDPVCRRGLTLVGVVCLCFALGSCRFVSTELSRITASPGKYHGRDVTVSGRVEAVRWLPDTGAIGFRLTDGTDSILVLTLADAPPEGHRVRLPGVVSRRFPVEGQDRLVLLRRIGTESRENSGDTR